METPSQEQMDLGSQHCPWSSGEKRKAFGDWRKREPKSSTVRRDLWRGGVSGKGRLRFISNRGFWILLITGECIKRVRQRIFQPSDLAQRSAPADFSFPSSSRCRDRVAR